MKKLLHAIVLVSIVLSAVFWRELWSMAFSPAPIGKIGTVASARPQVLFLREDDPVLYKIGPVSITQGILDGEIVANFELINRGTMARPFPALDVVFVNAGQEVRKREFLPGDYEHPGRLEQSAKIRLTLPVQPNETGIRVFVRRTRS
jgi:hypothetical protein